MRVLILNGSPRPKGNTKQMITAFCEGLESAGHEWDVHAHKLNRRILQLVEPEDVIISASPIFLLDGIREHLNTDRIIGTEVDLAQKKITWFNFGDNKVKRYRTIYGDQKIDAFYTDSQNDKELMRVSREVYIVKNGIPVHL